MKRTMLLAAAIFSSATAAFASQTEFSCYKELKTELPRPTLIAVCSNPAELESMDIPERAYVETRLNILTRLMRTIQDGEDIMPLMKECVTKKEEYLKAREQDSVNITIYDTQLSKAEDPYKARDLQKEQNDTRISMAVREEAANAYKDCISLMHPENLRAWMIQHFIPIEEILPETK